MTDTTCIETVDFIGGDKYICRLHNADMYIDAEYWDDDTAITPVCEHLTSTGVNSMDTLNGYTTYRYDKYQELYLDYVNNFLTVKRFAEYYNMSIDYANHVIEVGRKLNNN